MSKDEARPIVIKRIKKVEAGHHGGVWKIAYADFVTAMMAFFLLMWLLGSTSKGDLNGISDYFKTPLAVAMAGGSGSGDSSSVIKGGGQDLTRQFGQMKRGEVEHHDQRINLQAAQAEVEREEAVRLEAVKQLVMAAIAGNQALAQYREQIKLELTKEGLRIQILDTLNRPMFDSGRARLKDYTREILREIGKVLNGVDHKVALSGHTDSKPYAGGELGYSNWELSAERANASRRELLAAGMDETKVLRVVGLAPSVPFDRGNPFDPANRRISIVVLNRETERQMLSNGETLIARDAQEAQRGLGLMSPEAPGAVAPAGDSPQPPR